MKKALTHKKILFILAMAFLFLGLIPAYFSLQSLDCKSRESTRPFLPTLLADLIFDGDWYCKMSFMEQLPQYSTPGHIRNLYMKMTASVPSTPAKNYTPPLIISATDHGKPIQIDKQNKSSSQWFNYLKTVRPHQDNRVIIVPGFSPEGNEAHQLHPKAKYRLTQALHFFLKEEYYGFILSGGNIHPKSTLYNESLEMKKYMVEVLKVPEFLIAIEPHAENSVTNLSYSGRLMLAHNLNLADIITTQSQNYYMGYPYYSTFHLRSLYLLKQKVGKIRYLEKYRSQFIPSSSLIKNP